MPNAAVVEAAAQEAPDLALHIAAGARLPYWPYWSGILTLIYTHRHEIPIRARGLAARVADLWLRTTHPSWPLRKEAAAIAVELGDALLKEKEEHNWLFHDGEIDRHIYRAVLAAGHEEPERVKQIVLEAAGRRDQRFAPPPLTEEELAKLKKKRLQAGFPPSLGGDYGPLSDPWPHGPAFRVDGALQEAVLETDALIPLAEALPDVAREVLLALLISEPKRRSSFYNDDLHDRYGLEWPNWHPQFYTRGPFRSFLATSEEAAVTAILQLVDHATDRWAEARARRVAREQNITLDKVPTPTVEIDVEGEMRGYVGDAQVYNWSLYGPDPGMIVGSALAALEKHLYDRAEAGEDLTPLIHLLLTESRSLAIVGLLGVFGHRHPQYLRGPLRGLLGSLYTLRWTVSGSESKGWEFPLSPGFSLVPEPLQSAYREWHEMPHRKTSLRDWAVFFLINDPNLRPFFNEVRERLIAGLQPGGQYEGWGSAESLLAQLDPDNYDEVKGDDGKTYVLYTPPEDLRRKHAEAEETIAADLVLMTLPARCRQILRSEEEVDDGTLNELWEQAQQVADLDPDAGGDIAPPTNALAGVAAVIILRGEDWRAKHPDREEWARENLLQAAHEDRSGEYGAVPNWDRLAFAAEALPVLWAETSEDRRFRETVAYVALHSDSQTVGTFAAGVARIRDRLGDDHLRLIHAILLRAGLDSQLRTAENRAHYASYSSEGEKETAKWEKEAEVIREKLSSLERDLTEGTLDAIVPSLDEVAPLGSVAGERRTGRSARRSIPSRPINEGLIIAAYRGVPDPSGDGEDPWIGVWERAVHQSLAPLVQPSEEQAADPEGMLEPWDRYLMERVAHIVAVTEDPEIARKLWQPIIDLGASATDLVLWFTRSWTPYALFPGAEDHVVSSWIAMIDAAFANPRWYRGSVGTHLDHQTGKLWRALLGFAGFSYNGADVWNEDLRPRVQRLRPQLAAWADAFLTDPDNARIFAHFLTLPAATHLTLTGLVWLHDAASAAGERFWRWPGRGGSAENAVMLLDHVWNSYQTALRQDAAALAAFRGLLELLVSRQYAPAFELADRVGGFRQ